MSKRQKIETHFSKQTKKPTLYFKEALSLDQLMHLVCIKVIYKLLYIVSEHTGKLPTAQKQNIASCDKGASAPQKSSYLHREINPLK